MKGESWIDRWSSTLAPNWTLKRKRARLALEVLERHYEAAGSGRRTQGWRRTAGDANQVIGPALTRLRENARDYVRNNAYGESAVRGIADDVVGWGIVPKSDQAAMQVWKAWAESTDCDADGRSDFYGLEHLVQRTVIESGECLVRGRVRYPSDGFALPFQLQVLDPDYLDTTMNVETLANGGRIVQGVEYDPIGRRVAYFLFKDHPGSVFPGSTTSTRVPADYITHIFDLKRPGQVRGPSWFAPILLSARDFDEYEDATLMKQKIAACLAALVTDPTGADAALGSLSTTSDGRQTIDSLEPGAIIPLSGGKDVHMVSPPQNADYDPYARAQLRKFAAGIGTTYEGLSGDYTGMPFSAARMSYLKHWARIEGWRWRMIVPQFCVPAWRWAMQIAVVAGQLRALPRDPTWTAPPAPMIDPASEGLAYTRNIRAGLQSLSDVLRERGYDPDQVLGELASDMAKLDTLGLILDSDPRNMTQAGQLQGEALAQAAAAAPAADGQTPRAFFEKA